MLDESRNKIKYSKRCGLKTFTCWQKAYTQFFSIPGDDETKLKKETQVKDTQNMKRYHVLVNYIEL